MTYTVILEYLSLKNSPNNKIGHPNQQGKAIQQ